MMRAEDTIAGIAQLGERQTEDLKVACSIHAHRNCVLQSQELLGFIRNRVYGSAARRSSTAGQDNCSVAVQNGEQQAVFVGSNFRSIHKATKEGRAVVIVVSDKPECIAIEYAKEEAIAVRSFPRGKLAPDGLSPTDLVHTLRFSGATIHFVDEEYDHGRILADSPSPDGRHATRLGLYVEAVQAL